MKNMSRMRHFALVPLLLCAVQASAAGINLGWNDCPGGATYSLTRSFACNTNTGIHTLVGSFVAPAGTEAMTGNEIVIDIQTGGVLLADWWKMAPGQCRTAASLDGDLDFTAGPFTCYDYWQGGALGTFSWSSLPAAITNRCRIKGVFALPIGDARITAIPEGTHVYSFKSNISNAKSAGLGACGGCSDEACIVLNTIAINQPAPQPPRIPLTNPFTSAFVTWQGWSTINPAYDCPDVTPARSRSWGSIKALYR